MAESKPVEGEKKSSKKLLLIFMLLALLAGGGGAYYFLVYKASEPEQEAESNKPAPAEEKSVESEQANQELYYQLNASLIVNFPPGSSARIVKVAVAVLVKGEASVEVLKKHEPMIRNNLLMTISSVGADKMKTLEGKQELRTLMLTEIGKVMEKMAGKNTAKEIYFTEFVMQ